MTQAESISSQVGSKCNPIAAGCDATELVEVRSHKRSDMTVKRIIVIENNSGSGF